MHDVSDDTPEKLQTLPQEVLQHAYHLEDGIKIALAANLVTPAGTLTLSAGTAATLFTIYQKKLPELEELVNKTIFECIQGVFMPWYMPIYSEKWKNIAHGMQTIANELGPQGLRDPGASGWTGQAAQKYQELAEKYAKAAEEAGDFANEHRKQLQTTADEAKNLYYTLLSNIAEIIPTFILLALELSAGPVGVVAALITIIPAMSTYITSVIDIIREFDLFMSGQKSTYDDLDHALLKVEGAFPNRSWPKG